MGGGDGERRKDSRLWEKKIWTRALKFLFRKQLAAAVNRRKAGNGGESERS